jgi:hypothetical protein
MAPVTQNKETTMTQYQISTPRASVGLSAIAMTALTIGVFVVMPAKMEAHVHEPGILSASTVTKLASTSALDAAASDLIVAHETAVAPCALSLPERSSP